ncbi:MAG: transposase, partial [Candidatus Wildermuthbacteria bacterium]|nr:transposase [Candidatus Wildermuthbacteria bacterium]
MRTTQFVNGEFYHLYNRGVEKRDIFANEKDYMKFLLSLHIFNTVDSHENIHLDRKIKQGLDLVLPSLQHQHHQLLVDITAFCLMPNHYHLLVRQRAKNGIVRLIQRLGTGYTMYANKKYERTGVLFQGKFKSILVDKEEYLLALLNYIHLNPLDLKEYRWKENGIKNWREAQKFLEEYRWSSY